MEADQGMGLPEKSEMIRCPSCQHENEPDAQNCAQCGISLLLESLVAENQPDNEAKPTPEQQAGSEIRKGVTTLQVTDLPEEITDLQHIVGATGVLSGKISFYIPGKLEPIIVDIADGVTLGRTDPDGPSVTVDLTNYDAHALGVSRKHAVINTSDDGYTVMDLGSSNGTWLNTTQIQPNVAHLLRNGDQIRLGRLRMFVYTS